jgi:hypothetical protein
MIQPGPESRQNVLELYEISTAQSEIDHGSVKGSLIAAPPSDIHSPVQERRGRTEKDCQTDKFHRGTRSFVHADEEYTYERWEKRVIRDEGTDRERTEE